MFLRVFRFGICFAERFILLIFFILEQKDCYYGSLQESGGKGMNNEDD